MQCDIFYCKENVDGYCSCPSYVSIDSRGLCDCANVFLPAEELPSRILSELDDSVQRKYEWSKTVWDYKMNKRGEGFREALLSVRSMIHTAKERLK